MRLVYLSWVHKITWVEHGLIELNYVSIGQYLLNFPFNAQPFPDVQYCPYALKAISYLGSDRFGVSILHAFIIASSFTDAKISFEPLILLFPALTSLVIFLISKKFNLNQKYSLFAAIGAGILPALASIHLESFFAQAFAIPFLFLWPLVLCRVWEQLRFINILFSSVVLSAATSIYTEFYPLLLGAGMISLMFQFDWKQSKNKSMLLLFAKKILIFIFIISLAFLLNIKYTFTFLKVLQNIGGTHSELNLIYPWTTHIEGLTRIWLGDLIEVIPYQLNWLLGGISIALLIMSYSGLFLSTYKNRNSLSASILMISLFPLFLLPTLASHKYQFYKILSSISPLFPLGICLFLSKIELNNVKFLKKCLTIILFISTSLFFISLSSTFIMNLRTGFVKPTFFGGMGRGWTYFIFSPETKSIFDKLKSLKDQNIVIYGNDSVYGWFAYFARNNNVWFLNPSDKIYFPIAWLSTNIPSNFYLLLPSSLLKFNPQLGTNIVIKNEQFTFLKINKPVVILTSIDKDETINQNIGKTKIVCYSSEPCIKNFNFNLTPIPNDDSFTLSIKTQNGFQKNIDIKHADNYSIQLPLNKGTNTIEVSPIN